MQISPNQNCETLQQGAQTAGRGSYPPEAAACRQVLPKLSGVFMSNPADSTCSLLIDETILYSWPEGESRNVQSYIHMVGCAYQYNLTVDEYKPEESNLRQQSENPYSTAKCKGNIPWIPRLETEKQMKINAFETSEQQHRSPWKARGKPQCLAYLAVSAPLVIRVLISSSWPYLAAMWRGVLPYLSTQSISPPNENQGEVNHSCSKGVKVDASDSLIPFWMRIWERVKRPWMAAMCRGLFPSLLCAQIQRFSIKVWLWIKMCWVRWPHSFHQSTI